MVCGTLFAMLVCRVRQFKLGEDLDCLYGHLGLSGNRLNSFDVALWWCSGLARAV